jgi:MerR family redox-sensitive transcriptional activator SoxR
LNYKESIIALSGIIVSTSADMLVTIQEVCRQSGVTASALRYYETCGLITSRRLSRYSHRRYQSSTLQRINYIMLAQRAGFSLEEIAGQLAMLPSDREPTKEEWAPLKPLWIARIEERIADLEQLKVKIHHCTQGGDSPTTPAT